MKVLRWIFGWRIFACIQIIGVYAMLGTFAPELPLWARLCFVLYYAMPIWVGQAELVRRDEQHKLMERARLLPKGR